jgi:hypothetical protein
VAHEHRGSPDDIKLSNDLGDEVVMTDREAVITRAVAREGRRDRANAHGGELLLDRAPRAPVVPGAVNEDQGSRGAMTRAYR